MSIFDLESIVIWFGKLLIYLIFDFDPQDPNADFEILKSMLRFFNDSSSRGKLFINYPMMQSYRHIKCWEDTEFRNRSVQTNIGRRYKALVDKEASNSLKQINRLDRGGVFKRIIEMHLSKLNYHMNGVCDMPSYSEYKAMTGDRILDLQLRSI